MTKHPIALISGFSGAGKTTFWQELQNHHPDQIIKVTSFTTRATREGEIPGVHYHFISPEEFHEKKDNNHFLEWSAHYDQHYASPIPEELILTPDQIPLYTVDTNGAAAIKKTHPHAQAFFLYISPDEQYKRLTSRTTDQSLIASRLQRYEEEKEALEMNRDIYHILHNEEPDDLKKAIEYFRQTMQLG